MFERRGIFPVDGIQVWQGFSARGLEAMLCPSVVVIVASRSRREVTANRRVTTMVNTSASGDHEAAPSTTSFSVLLQPRVGYCSKARVEPRLVCVDVVLYGGYIGPTVVVARVSARAISNWAVKPSTWALEVHWEGRWWRWEGGWGYSRGGPGKRAAGGGRGGNL